MSKSAANKGSRGLKRQRQGRSMMMSQQSYHEGQDHSFHMQSDKMSIPTFYRDHIANLTFNHGFMQAEQPTAYAPPQAGYQFSDL